MTPEATERELELFCIGNSLQLSKFLLDPKTFANEFGSSGVSNPINDQLVLACKGYVYGKRLDEYEMPYPETLWEHIKQSFRRSRVCPHWLKARIYVRYGYRKLKLSVTYPDYLEKMPPNIGKFRRIVFHLAEDGIDQASVLMAAQPSPQEEYKLIRDAQTELDPLDGPGKVVMFVLDRLFKHEPKEAP